MRSEVRTKPRGNNILSRHPFWLGKYYAINIALYSIAIVFVLNWNHLFDDISIFWVFSLMPLFLNRFIYIAIGSFVIFILTLNNFWSELSLPYVPFILVAVYFGQLSAVLIHNAVHDNFKPKWLNPVIGEILALQQLSAGYPIARLVHNEHHSHPDDPKRDPHPPKGYSFLGFIDISRTLVLNRLAAIYYEKWGEEKKVIRDWKLQILLLLCSRFAKTFFLFSLLGPKVFVLIFLPSYLSTVLFFATFNYFTHRGNEDGSIEIINLDTGWFFKLCNKTLFGVMYHKSHHFCPKLFNPMDYEVTR